MRNYEHGLSFNSCFSVKAEFDCKHGSNYFFYGHLEVGVTKKQENFRMDVQLLKFITGQRFSLVPKTVVKPNLILGNVSV